MRKKSCALLVAILIIVNSPGGFAQKAEVGFFAGGSFFSNPSFASPDINNPPGNQLLRTNVQVVDGGVYGVRAREYFTSHIAAEQSWTIGGANNTIYSNDPSIVVGTRQEQMYFNGNFHMLSGERKVRPYFSAGIGWTWFKPTEDGRNSAAPFTGLFDNPWYGNFGTDSVFTYNYGAGLTARIANHIALDFSVRDFVYWGPTFKGFDPSQRDVDNNLQVMGGVNIRIGGAAPLIVHNFTVSPTIDASNTALCPGDSAQLHIVAADSIPGNQVTYQWTENGKQVATGPEYTYVAPSNPGNVDIGVHVFYTSTNLDKAAKKAVEKNPGMPQERKTTLTVKDYSEPTAIATADQSTVQRGQRVMLTSSAKGSECSGNLAYRWSASDGRLIAGTDATTTIFDGSNLPFSDTMQGQQCKPVTVNLEVIDQRGGTGKDAKNLQVCYTAPAQAAAAPPPPAPPVAAKPTAIQLSDINFALNSTRVNNCAKRVLGDELYPQLTSSRYSDYDVVLVGHRDLNEKTMATKTSKSTLDRDRVMNAAAYLSASGATCKDLERTRIRVEWKGSEQDADFRSNFCDGSTIERGKDHVSSADSNAKNRRVEIWLVPRDVTVTPNATADSSAVIAALGCPK